MLKLGYEVNIAFGVAQGENLALEKAKEQDHTLENQYPANDLRCDSMVERIIIEARLVLEHKDDESGCAVERSDIHSDSVYGQIVSLSNVFAMISHQEVADRIEAIAEGIDDGVEDQTIDQEHLYPKPLLEGVLFFR